MAYERVWDDDAEGCELAPVPEGFDTEAWMDELVRLGHDLAYKGATLVCNLQPEYGLRSRLIAEWPAVWMGPAA